MLLGYFLKQIGQTEPQAVTPEELQPGSVVVAVANMQQLREIGLPCAMRFGIVESEKIVICRCPESESMDTPNFKVKRLSMAEFAGEGMTLYRCHVEGDRSRMGILMKAQMQANAGPRSRKLCSYPGDDFVAECISNSPEAERVQQLGGMGQHWWTPLKMTLKESLKWIGMESWSDKLPEKANLQVFDQTHHGVAIEGEQVIHFSTRRVPDGTNHIKTDSLPMFRAIGDETTAGSPVHYDEETPEQRLLCRNRAVWVFFHSAEWGTYNLAANNCEHFSRYCRIGKKESLQVKAAVMKALALLLGMIPHIRPLAIALRAFLNKITDGLDTPIPGSLPPAPDENAPFRLPEAQ